ncbi:hypothetical protein CJ030_MR2G016869 [Morella rubra]|uniref:Uncharacterized protein n=1 Tax=Morella rubra TaxID=262757 RepID=A0A6A1WE90_9ROSI|nr:hypothetical protein CJ030_MR2G016869 [Morella rubra]
MEADISRLISQTQALSWSDLPWKLKIDAEQASAVADHILVPPTIRDLVSKEKKKFKKKAASPQPPRVDPMTEEAGLALPPHNENHLLDLPRTCPSRGIKPYQGPDLDSKSGCHLFVRDQGLC